MARADVVDHRWEPEADPLTTALHTRVVLAALLRLTSPRPWLLAIDDVDRIDQASRAVLAELLTDVVEERVMFLGSAGPDDTTQASLPTTTVLELDSLDDAHSTGLVIEIAPALRDDQVERIVRAGRGNPFVLAELAHTPEWLGSSAELPDSLHRLGAALVDALPPPVRAVVRDAATFGSTVPLEAFADLLQRPELADHRWWSVTFPVLRPGAAGTVVFRHDALRVAAHESLTFRRRRELHGAIAARLVRLGDANEAELAFHYEQAGMAALASATARSAGLAAKASGAMAEACDLLAMAIRLPSGSAPQEVGSLRLERGEALSRLGDLDGAEGEFVAAGRRLTDPAMYARMCHERTSVALTRSRFRQARTWVRKGLDVLAPLGDGAAHERGRLLLDRAAVLHLTGRHEQSLAPAGDALALAIRTRDRILEGLAHVHLGMAYVAMMRPEALDHVEAAVVIFEAIGHDRYLNSSLNNSGLIAMYLGRWDDAIDRYRRVCRAWPQGWQRR